MRLIQKISSTLKIWVFKKKVLAFSSRFRRDPQACFYCPEMCRFSCPTAEAMRDNAVTPRAKMSLLHLEEKGVSAVQIAGGEESRLWFLEQCVSCGRCTEFCLHEVDVAGNLQAERTRVYARLGRSIGLERFDETLERLSQAHGSVLFSETGRGEWWKKHSNLLSQMGQPVALEAGLPVREAEQGLMEEATLHKFAVALSKCKEVWVESPEDGMFLAMMALHHGWKGKLRFVWQALFTDFAGIELGLSELFHESSSLSRKLPRLGYSVPMYERGLVAFHHGWNAHDCGGESFFTDAHPHTADEIARRFLDDLSGDGRQVDTIVCQNLSCVKHLKKKTAGKTKPEIVYWLDFLEKNRK